LTPKLRILFRSKIGRDHAGSASGCTRDSVTPIPGELPQGTGGRLRISFPSALEKVNAFCHRNWCPPFLPGRSGSSRKKGMIPLAVRAAFGQTFEFARDPSRDPTSHSRHRRGRSFHPGSLEASPRCLSPVMGPGHRVRLIPLTAGHRPPEDLLYRGRFQASWPWDPEICKNSCANSMRIPE
jgi:hypothetical protein